MEEGCETSTDEIVRSLHALYRTLDDWTETMSNAFLFFSLVTRMTGRVFNWCFHLHHEQQTVQWNTVFSEFSSAFNGVSSKHDLVIFLGGPMTSCAIVRRSTTYHRHHKPSERRSTICAQSFVIRLFLANSCMFCHIFSWELFDTWT